ncbi:uncharacterized protein [Venturia canescens]|uniref:uncharacterized protein n=1 Tax=Venturia canescens TaxID=32260 RepID=UPI001C9D2FE2|nr:uncharacterized protein LOC122413652 [Venturia canescens]
MFKFGITLCFLFIFVYTAEAKLLEYTKDLYDAKVSTLIQTYQDIYKNANQDISSIIEDILEKLRAYRTTTPIKIIEEFEKKQIEADALVNAATTVDIVDCLNYISNLDALAEKATKTVRDCSDSQLGAVEGNYTKIQESISEAFKKLETYKENAENCHKDPANSSNAKIIHCLRPIKSQLIKDGKPKFEGTIKMLNFWLRNFDRMMEACASENLNIFYGNASTLTDTVKKCIETKINLKKSAAPVTQTN